MSRDSRESLKVVTVLFQTPFLGFKDKLSDRRIKFGLKPTSVRSEGDCYVEASLDAEDIVIVEETILGWRENPGVFLGQEIINLHAGLGEHERNKEEGIEGSHPGREH